MFRVEWPGEGPVVAVADPDAIRLAAADARGAEEGLPQRENLACPPECQLLGSLHHRRDLGAIGPVELPRCLDGSLDHVVFDGVAGLELVDPGVEAFLIGGGILAGEDRQLGAAAVLEGIEPRPLLACLGFRPGRPLGVAAVDLGSRE